MKLLYLNIYNILVKLHYAEAHILAGFILFGFVLMFLTWVLS